MPSIRKRLIVVGDRILVKLQDGEERTNSGLVLPATAVKYIRRIEELIQAPVALLSTSPNREDTILVHDPFLD